MKLNLKSHYDMLLHVEQETGLRFCRTCDKMLPLERFAIGKREYVCMEHSRAMHLDAVLGTPEKRAFNTLRCRARKDMFMFGHLHMKIGINQVVSMLSAAQIADYTNYALVPIVPSKPLAKDNAVIITKAKWQFVVGNWKASTRNQDDAKYKRDLDFIINSPA